MVEIDGVVAEVVSTRLVLLVTDAEVWTGGVLEGRDEEDAVLS